MSKVWFSISMSLDGYVAGPDPREEEPLGDGGEGLHEWAFATQAWREAHDHEGGGASPDGEIIAETIPPQGASSMGRGWFGGGTCPPGIEPRTACRVEPP